MNMTNLYKQAATMLAMLATLFLVYTLDVNLYQTIMMAVGGWQIGVWCGGWARLRWPLRS